ncbi:MAG: phosphate acyltransferase PlsX [Helicobacter sp.]|nr:phosphate acyltransferase PlsX [Helicobacter sp.]
MKIILDAMGADHGVDPIIAGAYDALKERNDFSIILVGDTKLLKQKLQGKDTKNIEIMHADDFIKMDESAANAIKRKDSSIYQGMQMLKEQKAHALISAGHSGATMSLATLMLGRIQNISRPAICTMMPTVNLKPSLILDAGANTDCKSEFLVDFAKMGFVYCKHFLGYANPRVGLLANGEEDSKGNELTKEVFKLLKDEPFFIGNVEGSDIFNGSVDVIVCDGYTGNIALKAAEGVANAIFTILRSEVKKTIFTKLGALFLKPAFLQLKKQVDYAEYGGAPLLGIKGNVIISHGKSNARAITSAINQAVRLVEIDILSKMSQTFA